MFIAEVPPIVPVLVPRREDHGGRDAVWAKIREDVWRNTPVIEGHHLEGPFNRSAALNTAAAAAGSWKFAVIADADSFVTPGSLAGAIQLAHHTGRVVIAHSRWVNVDLDEISQLLWDGWIEHRDDRATYNHTVSSMLVVPRTVWDTVNGFDERFEGWGREDNAFIRAVKVLTEPPLRIDGTVYHLAHDRPVEDTHRTSSPLFRANERRWVQYRSARTPEQMRDLVQGNRAKVLA